MKDEGDWSIVELMGVGVEGIEDDAKVRWVMIDLAYRGLMRGFASHPTLSLLWPSHHREPSHALSLWVRRRLGLRVGWCGCDEAGFLSKKFRVSCYSTQVPRLKVTPLGCF